MKCIIGTTKNRLQSYKFGTSIACQVKSSIPDFENMKISYDSIFLWLESEFEYILLCDEWNKDESESLRPTRDHWIASYDINVFSVNKYLT